jgi:hypothetical protein
MPAAPEAIVILATEKGRTFPETGLIVLRESHGAIRRTRPAAEAWSSRDIDAVRTYDHESVHFLQSLTSGYLFHHSLRYIDACRLVLRAGGAPTGQSRDIIEKYRDLTFDRAHEPGKRIDIKETPDGTLFVPVPPEQTISAADILEGVADLAAFQRTTRGATARDYVDESRKRYAGNAGATYWNTFSYLAGEVGLDGAYQCLCPLSFVTLNSSDPATTFTTLVAKAKELGSSLADACRDLGALFKLIGDGRIEDHFVFRRAKVGDIDYHPTLTPCLEYALQHVPPRTLLEYAANPAAMNDAPEAHCLALHPPVIITSSDRTGKVTTMFNGRASGDRDFGSHVMHFTAACGAAERLLFPTQSRYQFCPHNRCEHYEAGLCFRYFTPPSVERGHENCQFPKSFELLAGVSPKAAWTAIGFQRKTVDEVVAEFQSTGEAGLLALVRRQKSAIVEWLGRDGFRDLEWKCDVTAQKAVRAIQTNKIDDAIEARAFRDAVVREVERRAAESRAGGAANSEGP